MKYRVRFEARCEQGYLSRRSRLGVDLCPVVSPEIIPTRLFRHRPRYLGPCFRLLIGLSPRHQYSARMDPNGLITLPLQGKSACWEIVWGKSSNSASEEQIVARPGRLHVKRRTTSSLLLRRSMRKTSETPSFSSCHDGFTSAHRPLAPSAPETSDSTNTAACSTLRSPRMAAWGPPRNVPHPPAIFENSRVVLFERD